MSPLPHCRVGLAIELELELYPALAALTAVAFFAMGSAYWGTCYLIGCLFLAVPFLMTLDLRWAPVEYGVLWGAVLFLIALRLQSFAKKKQREHLPNT